MSLYTPQVLTTIGVNMGAYVDVNLSSSSEVKLYILASHKYLKPPSEFDIFPCLTGFLKI